MNSAPSQASRSSRRRAAAPRGSSPSPGCTATRSASARPASRSRARPLSPNAVCAALHCSRRRHPRSKTANLESNLAALELALTDADLAAIEAAVPRSEFADYEVPVSKFQSASVLVFCVVLHLVFLRGALRRRRERAGPGLVLGRRPRPSRAGPRRGAGSAAREGPAAGREELARPPAPRSSCNVPHVTSTLEQV